MHKKQGNVSRITSDVGALDNLSQRRRGDMWFVCFAFFAASSSAFPLGVGNELENYRVQLVQGLSRQRHSICLPSPFFGPVCLPSALQFFMPLETLGTGPSRCLSIPIMRAYALEVCPPRQTLPEEPDEGFIEIESIIEHVGAEAELVPDNEDVEVNEKENGWKLLTEEERPDGKADQKAEDKNFQVKNKITSEEIEVGGKNSSSERPATDKNAEDEDDDDNVSMSYNLV